MNRAATTCPQGFSPRSAQKPSPPSSRHTAPRSCFDPYPHAPLPPLDPGSPIGGTPYVVVRLLGQGGMGEIYEVEHTALEIRSALKILHRAHRFRPDLIERTRREACSLARIDHPNLVRVFDFGHTEDARPYFVMELLHGRDLRAALALTGYLPVSLAASLVAQGLDGLAAVHAKGFIHRDIKLENLFLCDSGALKIVDFGIAKALCADALLTLPGVALGTPRSMAPEQSVLAEVDARADLYAMGLVLYELITGRGPFDELGCNVEALRYAHCETPPPMPSAIAPQPVSPAIEAVLLRALAKYPHERFQSASEMAAALRAAIPEPPEPNPAPLPIPWRNDKDRAFLPLALSALAAASFLLGIATGRALLDPTGRDELRTTLATAPRSER